MGEAAIWAVGGLFWCSIFFILSVSVFWRWWRSPLGRALVTFDIFMTVSFGPATCDELFGWPNEADRFWQWEAIIGFGAVACAILWKTWVIYRVQAGPEDDLLSNRQALRKLTGLARRRNSKPVP